MTHKEGEHEMTHLQNSLSLRWLVAKALLKPQALPPFIAWLVPSIPCTQFAPTATKPPVALRLLLLMSHHAPNRSKQGLFCTDLTTSHSSHVHAGSKK